MRAREEKQELSSHRGAREREELNKNLKSLGLVGTCGRYLRRVLALYKLSRLKFSQSSYDKIIERRGSPFRGYHVLHEAAISVNPKYTLGFSFHYHLLAFCCLYRFIRLRFVPLTSTCLLRVSLAT